jgi:hypothetical protein
MLVLLFGDCRGGGGATLGDRGRREDEGVDPGPMSARRSGAEPDAGNQDINAKYDLQKKAHPFVPAASGVSQADPGQSKQHAASRDRDRVRGRRAAAREKADQCVGRPSSASA